MGQVATTTPAKRRPKASAEAGAAEPRGAVSVVEKMAAMADGLYECGVKIGRFRVTAMVGGVGIYQMTFADLSAADVEALLTTLRERNKANGTSAKAAPAAEPEPAAATEPEPAMAEAEVDAIADPREVAADEGFGAEEEPVAEDAPPVEAPLVVDKKPATTKAQAPAQETPAAADEDEGLEIPDNLIKKLRKASDPEKAVKLLCIQFDMPEDQIFEIAKDLYGMGHIPALKGKSEKVVRGFIQAAQSE